MHILDQQAEILHVLIVTMKMKWRAPKDKPKLFQQTSLQRT